MKLESSIDKILIIILIISIIFAFGTITYVIMVPKTGEKFTEFYILGADGNADNYPTNLNVNMPTDIIVGVINHEYSIVNYTVQIKLDKDILASETLALDHNKIWQKNITFSVDKKETDMKLEFLLFKENEENNFTNPYRDLHLWINAT